MVSKTPQFGKALDEYFSKLELDEKGGQWRVCRFSGEKFYVRPEDIEFYKKIRVPLPTLSPKERRRKRSAAHNSYTLFKKTSAYSGEKVISIHEPKSPFRVYEHQIWYSDKWNPLEYGREYDFTSDFFSQFYKLQLDVPRPNLVTDPANINSDYVNVSRNLKNCYLTFDQNGGEDLYYHQCCTNDKNCIECWAINFSDTCYECKMGERIFKCFWCEECRQCIESYFLWDCRNCDYCFMSSGLRNKKYYFRNRYIGKDEFEHQIRKINFGSFKTITELKKEFLEMKLTAPHKPTWNEKSVNCFGDYIRQSRNIYYGLYVAESENSAYVEGTGPTRESYDILGGSNIELCYELSNVWAKNDFGCKFSNHVDNCRGVELSDLCINCRNCFGCVGLRNKEFCILNLQYSEEEYWKTVDRIKTKMLRDGEYGEFFPPQYFTFPYRSTTVEAYAGFDDYENARRFGYDVAPPEIVSEEVHGDIVNAADFPDDIRDVKDDILDKIIFDKNKKHFRILKGELAFYRKYSVPLPHEHPTIRMNRWRKEFNLAPDFFERKCGKCAKSITTIYAPNRPERNVYCEPCYQNSLR